MSINKNACTRIESLKSGAVYITNEIHLSSFLFCLFLLFLVFVQCSLIYFSTKGKSSFEAYTWLCSSNSLTFITLVKRCTLTLLTFVKSEYELVLVEDILPIPIVVMLPDAAPANVVALDIFFAFLT